MTKIIKSFDEFIKEEADYRNVTGAGSMGGTSQQNAGPSFNKGPDSATYHRPDVISVETDFISDPYFSKGREQRRKRVKKNKHIEKNRKDKSKYLDKIDKDTQKKVLEEWWDLEALQIKENERLEEIKKYLPSAYLAATAYDGQGHVLLWEIMSDAQEFIDAKGSYFVPFERDMEGLQDLVDELKNLGADDIEVGGIELTAGSPWGDTLYFRNVEEEKIIEPFDPDIDDFHTSIFTSYPDELDHWKIQAKIDKVSAKVNPKHAAVDPYGEERWEDEEPGFIVKPSNQWRAWWD